MLHRACTRDSLDAVHDRVYKRLFSDPRVVEDLLRGFVPVKWVERLDFTTLRRLPSEYVSRELHHRLGDLVWRVEPGASEAPAGSVLVLLELQSTVDRAMAARMMTYCALAWEALIRRGLVGGAGLVPATLPVVFYNGASRWTAAEQVGEPGWPGAESVGAYQGSQRYVLVDAGVLGAHDLPPDNRVSALIGLENSRSVAHLIHILAGVFERFGGVADRDFRESLYEWARYSPLTVQGPELPAFRDLEGGTMPTLLEARAKEWEAQWFREGHERGVAEGRAEGVAAGRAELLRGQLVRKFGAAEGERVSALIEHIRDPDQLARIGMWLIECETASALLARVERLPNGG